MSQLMRTHGCEFNSHPEKPRDLPTGWRAAGKKEVTKSRWDLKTGEDEANQNLTVRQATVHVGGCMLIRPCFVNTDM